MTDPALRRHGRRALAPARFLAGALALVAGLAGVAVGQEDGDEIRGFSIPNTPNARALVYSASDHLGAERWNEALVDLQKLIEQHGSGLVLDEEADPDKMPVHRSAAGWATERLKALPAEVAQLYRRRYEARARATLELARGRSDRQAVIAVAERWPISETATLAWWTVGDLEFERGNLHLARWAWSRALWRRAEEAGIVEGLFFDGDRRDDWQAVVRALASDGSPLGEGEAKRVEYALAALTEGSSTAQALPAAESSGGSLRLPGEGEGAYGAPGPQASTWPSSFHLPSPRALEDVDYENLFPIRVGDLVLLSDSLQLFAVGAYSGLLRWKSEMPEGWARLKQDEQEQFFAGVSPEDTMIAPAASREICVAALQVPVTDITNESYRNIAITTIIPDRRLYAYDVETGTELWNHHPPPLWDGETGSFTDRMSVAGPPVVSGSRVLVPMHRMYGRIEFYVACFDLESGELLWATQLVSGQRELNMFARAEKEFSAPPLRVQGDAVIALTQLGAIASLDLFSGRILWETIYEQIPMPGHSHPARREMRNFWRNAPPVVADGVVVATPFDSPDLIGLDLQTGEERWPPLKHAEIVELAKGSRRESPSIDVLIGADARAVFLGGWPVVALRAAGGLFRERPRRLAWRFPSDRLSGHTPRYGRAVLLSDRVIIPLGTERIEVDRYGGSLLEKRVPWRTGRSGNLLVEGGTMYTLTPRHLDGYFEWDVLLGRARQNQEADPEALAPTLYLASLLAQRGRTESEEGRGDVARDWLDEALELLEPFAAREPIDPEVRVELHRTLRSRARVSSDLADTRSAVRALRRARTYAPDPGSMMATLFEEYELVRGGYELDDQRSVLAEMETSCGTRTFLARIVSDTESPRGWRLAPTIIQQEQDPYDPEIEALPVSLWIALERADLAAYQDDVEVELFHLHRLIESWPDTVFREERLADLAGARLRELIEVNGREIYEPFEARARTLLEEARESRDWLLLLAVSELYPASLAGREANDELLRWAVDEGDVEAVTDIVDGELPEVFAPELADERQIALLLHVGAVLQREGNLAFPATLYRALAERAPDFVSPVPDHLGLSIENLALDLDRAEAAREPAAPPRPTFTADALRDPGSLSPGEFTFLGRIPPPLDSKGPRAADVLLYAKGIHLRPEVSLVAYSTDTVKRLPAEHLWEETLSRGGSPSRWRQSVAMIPGAVVISSPDGVYARDRDSGRWLWSCPATEGDVDSIRAAGGLIIITERNTGARDTLYAVDSVTGDGIWSAPVDRIRYDYRPVCGERHVVLLPRNQRSQGLVLDLFTGRRILEFELPERVLRSAQAASWIEDGRLIVPWFLSGRSAERNRIVAIDLYSGQLAWNVSFDDIAGGRRELRSIVQHDGHTYLILRPQGGLEQEGVRGIVVELHTTLGATARVGSVELSHGDRPIGVPQERRLSLDEPYLYLRSFPPGGEELRIQAMHLPYGNLRWTQRLKLPQDQLYNALMRLPASSDSTVAIAVSNKTSANFGRETSLYFFDRSSGLPRGNLLLDGRLGTSADISLQGLGNTLILAGSDLLEVMR